MIPGNRDFFCPIPGQQKQQKQQKHSISLPDPDFS